MTPDADIDPAANASADADNHVSPVANASTDDGNQVSPIAPRVLFTNLLPPVLPAPSSQIIRPAMQTQMPAPPPAAGEGSRRSPRLAMKPLAGLPMSLRAQLNLCRKMGLAPPEGSLTAKAVSDFKAMFNSPLPQDAIDALEQPFGLNREDAKPADVALVKFMGPTDGGVLEELVASA
ncbi:uncharacterized protein LOC127755408 [Oryza glaberrima]|uniref:uncharacterized protein LOC127755408 n=1 Tax=Oryza glaberrima TaxID=4538 RepID=UPI00224C165C|nr:uncharacterized protein LOC127755408 [Oryza glaberrima]